MARLESVSPISGEDVANLPVKELAPAIAYYVSVLGFATVSHGDGTASLSRDEAQIGLVVNDKHEPHNAGSLAFRVDDLDALHRELIDRGGNPGKFDLQEWDGKRFRTFFMREDRDGYCYCFYHPA